VTSIDVSTVRRVLFSVIDAVKAAFVFHKGLSFVRRQNSAKKHKDIAYLVEVLRRERWREEVLRDIPRVLRSVPRPWRKRFHQQVSDIFSDPAAEGPRWVSEQIPSEAKDQIRADAYALVQQLLEVADPSMP